MQYVPRHFSEQVGLISLGLMVFAIKRRRSDRPVSKKLRIHSKYALLSVKELKGREIREYQSVIPEIPCVSKTPTKPWNQADLSPATFRYHHSFIIGCSCAYAPRRRYEAFPQYPLDTT